MIATRPEIKAKENVRPNDEPLGVLLLCLSQTLARCR
jgi:hypothetical protein